MLLTNNDKDNYVLQKKGHGSCGTLVTLTIPQ